MTFVQNITFIMLSKIKLNLPVKFWSKIRQTIEYSFRALRLKKSFRLEFLLNTGGFLLSPTRRSSLINSGILLSGTGPTLM